MWWRHSCKQKLPVGVRGGEAVGKVKEKITSQGTQHRKLLLIKIIVELLETLNIREFFSFCSWMAVKNVYLKKKERGFRDSVESWI